MRTLIRMRVALVTISALITLGAIYAALVYAPSERQMGELQRIFYFHMPTAMVAFLAFAVTFVASIAYLASAQRRWDALACSATEIGMLFASLVLLTGMLWARAAWNTWWTWDPRLTTTLVLWLIYAGYLILRRSVDGEARRARFSAVVGIIGFIDVPVVFMAIRWWRTIHPVIFEGGTIHLGDPRMLVALLVSLAAFVTLFVVLLMVRVDLETMAGEVEYLRRRVG